MIGSHSSCNTDQIKDHQTNLVNDFNKIYETISDKEPILNFFKFLKYILEIKNIFVPNSYFWGMFGYEYKNNKSDCISILFDLKPIKDNNTSKSIISSTSTQINTQAFKLLIDDLDQKIKQLSKIVEQSPKKGYRFTIR